MTRARTTTKDEDEPPSKRLQIFEQLIFFLGRERGAVEMTAISFGIHEPDLVHDRVGVETRIVRRFEEEPQHALRQAGTGAGEHHGQKRLFSFVSPDRFGEGVHPPDTRSEARHGVRNMSFEIVENERLGASIRRVACEQIVGAIKASRAARNGKGSPVHRTRKHLKKARAALGLLAVDVKDKRFQREKCRLRDAGRLISDIRDAEVRLETVKQLRSEPNEPCGRGCAETEELLAFELESFIAAFAGWQDEAARNLERAREGIGRWELPDLTSAKVCCAVRKSYRKGRHALKRVEKKETAKRFHTLRKRAKELRHQLRLLRPMQQALFREMTRDLKALSDTLGHAHDLSFVAQRLRSIAGATGRKRQHRALRALLETREKDLWRTALALAERFYALKPKEFSAQIAYYFEESAHARTRAARHTAAAG